MEETLFMGTVHILKFWTLYSKLFILKFAFYAIVSYNT